MIFLGTLFQKQKENYVRLNTRNGSVANQANSFQWNCIDGLYENGVKDLRIINVLPVGTWIKSYKKLFLRSDTWEYGGNYHNEIGSINLPVFKQFFRYKKILKIFKKSNDKKIVIYSAYEPFLHAISKLDKSYDVTLIVTDLPQFSDFNKTGVIKKLLRKTENRKIYKRLNRVDKFVILTEQMKEPLKIGDKPYVVVEGICSPENSMPKPICDNKALLYTGSLNGKFGIMSFIDAFMFLPDKDCELWLCGVGECVDKILELSKQDKRIKYFGYVSKSEAEDLQRKAAFLFNPRKNDQEFTKYSFPSKTMEYLKSGTPVIMYKLLGVPSEYDEFLNYISGDTVERVAEEISAYIERREELLLKAERAREFVVKYKNPRVQAEKILRLINK